MSLNGGLINGTFKWNYADPFTTNNNPFGTSNNPCSKSTAGPMFMLDLLITNTYYNSINNLNNMNRGKSIQVSNTGAAWFKNFKLN